MTAVHGKSPRLPVSAAVTLAVAILMELCCMGLGFWSSWGNLSAGAAAHGWAESWHLPATLDCAVVAFVLLDQIAVSVFGVRSRPLRWTAWAIAGFSVWANFGLASGDLTWRVIFAAMPALWVAGVEALRLFWRLLRRSADPVPDSIPAGRWLADPLGTLRMRRRMLLQGITSYAEALAVQRACLLARDLVTASPGWDESPALLRRQIGTWDVPAPVLAAIRSALSHGSVPDLEPVVIGWTSADLTRTERHAVSLTSARTAAGREASPEPDQPAVDAPDLKADHQPDGKPLRKPTKAAVRKMTGADLVPYVQQFLGIDPLPTKDAIMTTFHVGPAKAGDTLDVIRRSRVRAVV
jgi:hypothetical protein